MNKYHKKITNYMLDKPGVFVKVSKIRRDLKIGINNDNYTKAMQDLICNGRLESYPDGSVRINQ